MDNKEQILICFCFLGYKSGLQYEMKTFISQGENRFAQNLILNFGIKIF